MKAKRKIIFLVKNFFTKRDYDRFSIKFYQENNIPPWTRNRVPLIYLDTRLIMIPNLWVSEEVLASEGEKGIDLKWKDKLSF